MAAAGDTGVGWTDVVVAVEVMVRAMQVMEVVKAKSGSSSGGRRRSD